jgi:hypothetical protein
MLVSETETPLNSLSPYLCPRAFLRLTTRLHLSGFALEARLLFPAQLFFQFPTCALLCFFPHLSFRLAPFIFFGFTSPLNYLRGKPCLLVFPLLFKVCLLCVEFL